MLARCSKTLIFQCFQKLRYLTSAFDRPGVQALFSAVKRGTIDCIIVKDLSRFGRDSVEVGEYLERLFPLLQVRFISVNDGYDSRKKQYGAAGDLDIGVRNLINELYSRNVSVNVKTAKRQYAVRGECIAAYPFFGYVKGAKNRRQLEIDPPAAATVRMIFELWLEGHSTSDIANTLNGQSIPSPSMRKQQLGAKRANWSKLRENVPWTSAAVYIILKNERYTGKLISLRTVRKEIGKIEQKTIPKEDWIIVPDAFEPIISESDFQKAQSLFRPPTRKAPAPAKHTQPLFRRKVFCGICGLGLSRQNASRPYYRCLAPKGPLMEQCKAVRITEEDLKVRILAEVHSRAPVPADKAVLADSDTLSAKITMLEQRIEKQWSAKKDAFVKWNGGLLSKEEYEHIADAKQQEIQRLKAEIESLEQIMVSDQTAESRCIAQQVGASSDLGLTREMLDELVQSIHVFANGQVEIKWKV